MYKIQMLRLRHEWIIHHLIRPLSLVLTSPLSPPQAASTALRIQLAPSVHHQAAAMLSILVRYNWHVLSIVTSQVGCSSSSSDTSGTSSPSSCRRYNAHLLLFWTVLFLVCVLWFFSVPLFYNVPLPLAIVLHALGWEVVNVGLIWWYHSMNNWNRYLANDQID